MVTVLKAQKDIKPSGIIKQFRKALFDRLKARRRKRLASFYQLAFQLAILFRVRLPGFLKLTQLIFQ